MAFYTATGRNIKTPSAFISNDGLSHEEADTFFDALMQNLGTDFTYNNTMALLPGKQNRMKYRVSCISILHPRIFSAVDERPN